MRFWRPAPSRSLLRCQAWGFVIFKTKFIDAKQTSLVYYCSVSILGCEDLEFFRQVWPFCFIFQHFASTGKAGKNKMDEVQPRPNTGIFKFQKISKK
jgi:hypothetical protein